MELDYTKLAEAVQAKEAEQTEAKNTELLAKAKELGIDVSEFETKPAITEQEGVNEKKQEESSKEGSDKDVDADAIAKAKAEAEAKELEQKEANAKLIAEAVSGAVKELTQKKDVKEEPKISL